MGFMASVGRFLSGGAGGRQEAAPSIVVLTGAGVSVESGLPTFRGEDGLWGGQDVRRFATPEGFAADTEAAMAFYDERRREAATARPNAAHRALAWLERGWPGDFLLCTTNVDGLHEAAGSRRVAHVHGTLAMARCMVCGHRAAVGEGGMAHTARRCPACKTSLAMRPDVCLFRERPYGMDAVYAAIDRCDALLAVGCGGVVRPASLLPLMARRNSLRGERLGQPECRVVEVNPHPTGNVAFTDVVAGPAGTAVPRIVEALLSAVNAGVPPRAALAAAFPGGPAGLSGGT